MPTYELRSQIFKANALVNSAGWKANILGAQAAHSGQRLKAQQTQ